MMNNLFSMFDPSSSYISLSWMSSIPLILMMSNKQFSMVSKLSNMMDQMMNYIKTELKQLIYKNSKLSSEMMSKTFIMILLLNIVAINPFTFTSTAHMSLSFSLSLSMWMSVMMFGWMNNFSMMMAHLTPGGTPNNLMNFMVAIESVSCIIRPITLSIRLSANMVAGHLLMSLLSSFSMMNWLNMTMSFIPMMILVSLELMVAIVQAYVLTTLLTLYQNECN